jgi:hypothetical protein
MCASIRPPYTENAVIRQIPLRLGHIYIDIDDQHDILRLSKRGFRRCRRSQGAPLSYDQAFRIRVRI